MKDHSVLASSDIEGSNGVKIHSLSIAGFDVNDLRLFVYDGAFR